MEIVRAMPPNLTEILLTFLASTAVLACLGHGLGRRGQLERRLSFFMACLGLTLLARGFAWLWPQPWLERLMFLPALLIPLAALLFAEGLLRRHAPLALKALAAAGTLVFLVLNFSPALDHPVGLGAFVVFEVLVLVWIAGLLALRDRDGLAVNENRMADAVLVACLLALPLVVTDFRLLLGYPPLRMGSLAALILVYVLVRYSRGGGEKRAVMAELLAMLGKALVLGLAFWAVSRSQVIGEILGYAALAVAFVLVFTIFERLADLGRVGDQRSFLHWLRGVRLDSLDEFLTSLRGLSVMEDATVALPSQLQRYDLPRLRAMLAAEGGPVSLERTREIIETTIDMTLRMSAEQLQDLLLRNGANTVCLLRAQPLTLLLVNLPPVAASRRREAELAVIQKLAEGLDKGGRAADAPAPHEPPPRRDHSVIPAKAEIQP